MGDVQPDHPVELAPTAPSLYVQIRLLVHSLLTLTRGHCPAKVMTYGIPNGPVCQFFFAEKMVGTVHENRAEKIDFNR